MRTSEAPFKMCCRAVFFPCLVVYFLGHIFFIWWPINVLQTFFALKSQPEFLICAKYVFVFSRRLVPTKISESFRTIAQKGATVFWRSPKNFPKVMSAFLEEFKSLPNISEFQRWFSNWYQQMAALSKLKDKPQTNEKLGPRSNVEPNLMHMRKGYCFC